MQDLFLLVKIQFLGLFGLNKALHADKVKAKRTIALFVLACVGIGALFIAYSAGAAFSLAQFGLADYIPIVAVLVGFLAGAISAFAKTNGVLFAFKDYDIIMSMPLKTITVVLSRLLALYAMALLFSAIAMLPACGVYLAYTGFTFAKVVLILFTVFLAPLLPMALAILLAVGISALASRMRHANIITVVLSIAVIVVVIVVPYAMLGTSDFDSGELAVLVSQQLSVLTTLLPPVAWAVAGIVDGNILLYVAFAVASIVPVLIVVAVVSHWFTSINSALTASHSRGAFSFDEARVEKQAGPFKALLAKEARRLVSTPIYLMNSCIGVVLVLLAGIAAAVVSALGMLPETLFSGPFALLISAFLPWMAAFFVGITATTTASVSLEGKSRWLMYTAPVPARTVMGAKLALNLIIMVPTIIIGGALLAVAFRVDAFTGILTVVVPLAVCAFTSSLGLMIDAVRPRFDWTSEYEPVKRSFAVMITVLFGFLIMIVGVLVTTFTGIIGMTLLAVILFIGAWLLFRRIASTPLHE